MDAPLPVVTDQPILHTFLAKSPFALCLSPFLVLISSTQSLTYQTPHLMPTPTYSWASWELIKCAVFL